MRRGADDQPHPAYVNAARPPARLFCSTTGDDNLRSRSDREASDDRPASGEEIASLAKANHRTGIARDAARAARDLR
jgi:hypothetical protein